MNLQKCFQITFTKNKNKNNFNYALCNVKLSQVTELKDLGVLLDSKLHFDKHIENILNKAYQLFGFVMRASKDFTRANTYILLYKSLIRSQLEYAVSIWDPFYTKYKEQIEKIQRKFLRSLHFRCNRSRLCYADLLKFYKIPTLTSRRLFLQVVLLYKICNGGFDCVALTNQICYVVPRTVHRRECRSKKLFLTKACRTNAGKRSPMRRLVDIYNNHFDNIDIFAVTAPKFKRLVYSSL